MITKDGMDSATKTQE